MSTETIIILSIVGILFIVCCYLFLQLNSVNKKLELLSLDSSGTSLEAWVEKVSNKLKESDSIAQKNLTQIKDVQEQIDRCIQKYSLISYNAYNDVGGKLSFILCLLDFNNNGVIINSLHSRNTTRIYSKEVKGGKYEGDLSDEESQALSNALIK